VAAYTFLVFPGQERLPAFMPLSGKSDSEAPALACVFDSAESHRFQILNHLPQGVEGPSGRGAVACLSVYRNQRTAVARTCIPLQRSAPGTPLVSPKPLKLARCTLSRRIYSHLVGSLIQPHICTTYLVGSIFFGKRIFGWIVDETMSKNGFWSRFLGF